MARTKRKAAQTVKVREQAEELTLRHRLYRAGAYIRLSIEDSGKDTDDTIEAQTKLVCGYIEAPSDMTLHDTYCDNGHTGTNFSRPAFERMMEDVKRGAIDCIVVKDLSRFGRNYKEAGDYILRVFPLLDVRFIAVNDHFDSLTAEKNEFGFVIPLKNIVNESYSRDISRKLSSAIRTKELRGEFRGPFAPYGYQKCEADTIAWSQTRGPRL